MRAIKVSPKSDEQFSSLCQLYRRTRDVRVRTRTQMVLLAVDQGMTAPKIAEIVRENEGTVRAWLRRYEAEGLEGLRDRPRPGGPSKLTSAFVEEVRSNLAPGDVFYYADEFSVSWLPTLRAMWSPVGQQVMIPTPHQPYKRYGLGAVDYRSGETVVLFRRRKRRLEVAELLQALLDKHPEGTIYVAWDNSNTYEDDEVEAVLRAAAGRLVLLYLPTYSPWLKPIEMLWRQFRREVTHCELFTSVKALLAAAQNFFDRYNGHPKRVLSTVLSQNNYVVVLS